MKAEELRIGDYVCYKHKPHKVIEIKSSECLLKDHDGCFHYINLNRIEPILLTETILKNNHFIFHTDSEESFWIIPDAYLVLDIENDIPRFGKRDVKYVHELQHILLVWGLNDILPLI